MKTDFAPIFWLFRNQNSNQVGDIKKDDLPGPEALGQPGRKDQEVKMVRVGNTVEAHMVSTTIEYMGCREAVWFYVVSKLPLIIVHFLFSVVECRARMVQDRRGC